jgi:hypothetical protein
MSIHRLFPYLHLRVVLFSLSILWLMSCGTEQQGPSQPPSNPDPATTQTVDELSGVKGEITARLSQYYDDLSQGQIETEKYYAPVVDRFFSSKNILVENVDRSLQNSIQSSQNRTLSLDPNSVKVEQDGDGYIVNLSGKAVFTDGTGKVGQEEEFYNRIRLNQELLITSYESAGAPDEKARQLAPANRNAQILASRLLPALQEGKYQTVGDCVHPEYGFYLIVKPGAMPAPIKMSSLEEIASEAPAFKNGLTQLARQTVEAELPGFDCDEGFSKTGSFLAPVTDPYQGISELMAYANEEKRTYESAQLTATRELEKQISWQLVDTQTATSYYFGEFKGKWYLLAIDVSLYDCSA